MPAPRKVFFNGGTIFATSRMEEGLPLVPTSFLNAIIWSILAKAQMLYSEIDICAFIFLFNHFHMLLVVKNPEHVSSFIGYVKQEIAHAVNALLGREQRTIWKAEYDSPNVLDFKRTIAVLEYIYTNSDLAGLTESIDGYPGVSSWTMFKNDQTSSWHPNFSRDSIPKLKNPHKPHLEENIVLSELLSKSRFSCQFELKPHAWKYSFEESKDCSDIYLKSLIIENVRKAESQLRLERIATKQLVADANSLHSASMLREYSPTKHGKKMICLASSKELRVQFITFYKQLVERANDVFARWKNLDFSAPYPPGLFLPSRFRSVNFLSWRTALDAFGLAPGLHPPAGFAV